MENHSPFKIYQVNIHNRSNWVTRSLLIVISSVLFSLTLSGCVTFNDPESSQEYISDTIGILEEDTNIGQSFISRRPRLNGVTIWLSIPANQEDASSRNTLNVELFHSQADSSSIYKETLLLPSSGNNIPITIRVPVQENLPREEYYLQLSTNSRPVSINGRNEDAYSDGQVYINGQLKNADIAFRLSYNYDLIALLQDISQVIRSGWLFFPLLAVLWLPGWLVLEFTGRRDQFDFGEQLAVAFGLSIAIFPIIMLWTSFFRIEWTKRGFLLFTFILIALLITRVLYKVYKTRKFHFRMIGNSRGGQSILPPDRRISHPGVLLGLLTIFIITLMVRMIMIRDLATPAWVDSVHHALLTQLILSSGSYPSSILPFLDIQPASYHLGFHSIAAAFTWLSDLRIDQSLLILGQVLNALIVFPIYLFTKTLTKSSSAGLFAAIIAGLFTPMPAYYSSWGRYTVLTGLIILPVAFVYIQSIQDDSSVKRNFGNIILCAIASSGLFMVHYRVFAFLVILLLAYFLIIIEIKKKNNLHRPLNYVLLVFITTASSVLFVLPWLIHSIKNTLLPLIYSASPVSVPYFEGFTWAYLTSALGKQSLILAGVGLIWGMIKQKLFPFLLILWSLFLFFVANLGALRLPGAGLISNSSVEIILFVPIAILGGYTVDQLITSWEKVIPVRFDITFRIVTAVIISFISIIGSRQLVTIINPVTILTRQADIPAMDWMRDNIPIGETIVINPFAWGYGIYAGNDGGYWISPLTGRVTLPPPVLYGLEDSRSKINEQVVEILNSSSDPAALREYLNNNNYHYIYIGARGGTLSPETLLTSDLFLLLYHQGGVWIFSVKP